MPAPGKRRSRKRRRSYGRAIALSLCVVFAIIGVIPLSLGVLVRTARVRGWAARETASLLARELGISARYGVTVRAWPMMVALDQVVVDASDGQTPFLEVERVIVRPRVFSLLAGQFDVGDIEIVAPRLRVVLEQGKLTNLRYKLPEGGGTSQRPARSPVASVSVTDARVDAAIDGIIVT